MKFKVKYTVETETEYSVEELEEMLEKPLQDCTQWEILEAVKRNMEQPSKLGWCSVDSISFK